MITQLSRRLVGIAKRYDPPGRSLDEVVQFFGFVAVNGHGIMEPTTQETIGVGLFPSGDSLSMALGLPNATGNLDIHCTAT